MKIKWKIANLVYFSMLLTAMSTVSIGYNSITTVLNELNEYVFNKELGFLESDVHETIEMLVDSGLIEVDDYVHRAQQDLLNKVKSYKFRKTGHFIVFDQNRKIALAPEEIHDELLQKLSDCNDKKGQSRFSAKIEGDEKLIVFTSYIPTWQWTIGLAITESEFYSSRSDFLKNGIGISSLILIFIILTVTIISNRVTFPITELYNVAEKASKGDYQNRAKVNSQDEIGLLAVIFNEMISNIKSYSTRMEGLVKDRTVELEEKAEELKTNQKELMEASRKAGMAEVAIGFLHNIGNLLTSIFVKIDTLNDELNNRKFNLRVFDYIELLKKKVPQLEQFLNSDDGLKENHYWKALVIYDVNQRNLLNEDLRQVKQGLQEIEGVLNLQIKYSHADEVKLICDPGELLNRSLEVNGLEIRKNEIEIIKKIMFTGQIYSVGSKILQILVNIILNACQSFDDRSANRIIKVGLFEEHGHLVYSIKDNGRGIKKELQVEIFSFGFTTKIEGSGFGLHISALMASEIGGTLTVKSDGPNCGSEFILKIPMELVVF